MQIITAPHPMLVTECRADFVVTLDQIHQMLAMMRAAGGLGLAAPQVGIDARVFVTDWGQVFMNPVIDEHSQELILGTEGCLSLPGEFWKIGRWKWIRLTTGEVFEGLKARVVQHEVDHLDGVLLGGR